MLWFTSHSRHKTHSSLLPGEIPMSSSRKVLSDHSVLNLRCQRGNGFLVCWRAWELTLCVCNYSLCAGEGGSQKVGAQIWENVGSHFCMYNNCTEVACGDSNWLPLSTWPSHFDRLPCSKKRVWVGRAVMPGWVVKSPPRMLYPKHHCPSHWHTLLVKPVIDCCAHFDHNTLIEYRADFDNLWQYVMSCKRVIIGVSSNVWCFWTWP